jgi:hypothetical protein
LAVDETFAAEGIAGVVVAAIARVVVVTPTAAVVVTGAGPMGAVDTPAISDEIAGVNVPVMPVKVNLAEKASAGMSGLVGSGAERDWKRIKLAKPKINFGSRKNTEKTY